MAFTSVASASTGKGAKALLPCKDSAPRYRRSVTTRAPRKRTFVANMQKYVVQTSAPVGHSLVAQGMADTYSVCCDGGDNGAIGGGNRPTGGNGGRGDGFYGGSGSSGGNNDRNEGDGITAIIAVLGASLLAMLMRIPVNADALSAKASNSAWATITICSN